jgi:hypothetical protein
MKTSEDLIEHVKNGNPVPVEALILLGEKAVGAAIQYFMQRKAMRYKIAELDLKLQLFYKEFCDYKAAHA